MHHRAGKPSYIFNSICRIGLKLVLNYFGHALRPALLAAGAALAAALCIPLIRRKWRLLLVLCAVFFLATRLPYLGSRPGPYEDELQFAVPLLLESAHGTPISLLFEPYIGSGGVFLTSIFTNVFGTSLFSVRLPTVVLSLLGSLAFFFLFRRKLGPEKAGVALLFLASSPVFLFLSRMGSWAETLNLGFLWLGIFLLALPRSRGTMLAAGTVLGTGAFVKLSILGVALPAAVLLAGIHRAKLKELSVLLLVFLAANYAYFVGVGEESVHFFRSRFWHSVSLMPSRFLERFAHVALGLAGDANTEWVRGKGFPINWVFLAVCVAGAAYCAWKALKSGGKAEGAAMATLLLGLLAFSYIPAVSFDPSTILLMYPLFLLLPAVMLSDLSWPGRRRSSPSWPVTRASCSGWARTSPSARRRIPSSRKRRLGSDAARDAVPAQERLRQQDDRDWRVPRERLRVLLGRQARPRQPGRLLRRPGSF